MVSIRSDLQKQIEREVHEANTKLKPEFIAMLDRKVVLLEARMEAKVNEVHQDTTSTLGKLKETVAAVRESRRRCSRLSMA